MQHLTSLGDVGLETFNRLISPVVSVSLSNSFADQSKVLSTQIQLIIRISTSLNFLLISLKIFSTNSCNQKCNFCAAGFALNKMLLAYFYFAHMCERARLFLSRFVKTFPCFHRLALQLDSRAQDSLKRALKLPVALT